MHPVRLAMIGLGRFAEHHAKIWANMPEVEVTAICDLNPDRFGRFQRWFPKANTYTDWHDMLTKQKFDAVDVLTPETMHAGPALAAMEHGAHVFVEKPLAANPEEAMQLIQASKQYQRLLITGHVLRFDPRYREVKKQLEDGRTGRLRSICAKRANLSPYFSIYHRMDPEFILGIHDIDLLHWYFEDEVTEVYARKSYDAEGRCDLSFAMLSFAKGGIGIIENHWLLPEGWSNDMDIRMEIIGDQGMVQIQEPEQSVMFTGPRKQDVPTFTAGYEKEGQITGPLADELTHFISCIRSGQRSSSILDPMDAFRAVRAAWAVKQSAESGKPVTLPSVIFPGS